MQIQAVDKDPSRVRTELAVENAEQRGFSRSADSHNSDKLPALLAKAETVQTDLGSPVAELQILSLKTQPTPIHGRFAEYRFNLARVDTLTAIVPEDSARWYQVGSAAWQGHRIERDGMPGSRRDKTGIDIRNPKHAGARRESRPLEIPACRGGASRVEADQKKVDRQAGRIKGTFTENPKSLHSAPFDPKFLPDCRREGHPLVARVNGKFHAAKKKHVLIESGEQRTELRGDTPGPFEQQIGGTALMDQKSFIEELQVLVPESQTEVITQEGLEDSSSRTM
jgi:hypothetical protein